MLWWPSGNRQNDLPRRVPPRLLVRTIFPKSHANEFGFAHDPGKQAADPD
jgi:hypothetical protein